MMTARGGAAVGSDDQCEASAPVVVGQVVVVVEADRRLLSAVRGLFR